MTHSVRKGMGSVPYSDNGNSGVTFRVWAPFAQSVAVAGDFNHWSTNQNQLVSEGNGYWSADIASAHKGDEYKFAIKNQNGNGSAPLIWKTDPYAKQVHDNDPNYNAVVVEDDFDWGSSTFKMPKWNELVIYELHVASFNRDPHAPGNLNTLISKLDYLAALHINAILLLPVYGVAGPYSMGYNTALPFDIESTFGGPNEFKRLVKEAHQRGIAIIQDIVFNHFGPEDLDKCLWQFDGWSPHGKGGIYFYNNWKEKTAFGSRPDFGRGEVRQYLRDNIMMWMKEYRVDGFRFDSTVNIRNAYGNNNGYGDLPEGWSLMQWINNEIHSRMPWKISIAEDLQNNACITKDTDLNGAGFDSQWNSYYFHKLHDALITPKDEDRDMEGVKNAISFLHDHQLTKNVIYINNHDECAKINKKHRLPDNIWMGNADSWVARKRATLAAGILFTSPGIPMIFQGDEFFEWGQWADNESIDWSKRDKFFGIVNLYKTLIKLRRNWHNNTRGLKGDNINVFHVNNTDKLIAYHRWNIGGKGDDVVVIANFANKRYSGYQIGFPKGGYWHVRFNSDWNGYSPDFSNTPGYNTMAHHGGADNLNYHGNIGIAPYSLLIMSQ
ncbi:1,4-alpha-glucan branching protein [Labilibacter sediminis]|nr:1,4-alpha-glucan branching protein [Labilibacter sediminis]